MVGIPPETERDVLKGTTVHIPVYADATYLFIFRTLGNGIAVAINTLSSELAAGGARTDGSLVKATLASVSPVDILLQPIFNPVGGYGSYIVPAAFVLILQQLLLVGASLLTVVALAQPAGGAFASVLGRGVAHLTIYLPALALYFIVLPRFYGFSTLGQPLQLFALASLFVLATSFMAQAAGAWFKHPETPTLIFLGISIPQLFLTGFSWPREAIPQSVQAVGYIFPSDFAIDGIVRINQLGASLVGGGPRLARALVPRGHLFRARSDVRVSGEAEAGAWLAADLKRIAALGLIVVAIGAGGYWLSRPEPTPPIVGVVRTTEVRIAPEVGGQLAAIKVHKGDTVRAGDVVAELSAIELTASVGQARAALAAATADRNNVYAGVRAEQVASLKAEIAKAKSRLEYAEQQLSRTDTLARSETASQQALDQAQNDVASARADVAEAKANHDAAVAGPTKEERAIADAQVKAAASALAVLERRLDKTVLRAPGDGIVSVIVAEVGENIHAGQPVLVIEETGKQWLSFNAREDTLHGLTVGSTVDVEWAGGRERTPALVTELMPLGSFATWQAERAVGDHDRSTLRLRLDPQGDQAGLEPGMTVWLNR